MKDLGADAMSILRAAEGFDDPNPHDEERVRAKLSAQLGVGLGVAVLVSAKTAGAAAAVGTAGAIAGAGSSIAPPAVMGGAAGTAGVLVGATAGTSVIGKVSLGVVLLTALGGSVYAVKASRAPTDTRDVSHTSGMALSTRAPGPAAAAGAAGAGVPLFTPPASEPSSGSPSVDTTSGAVSPPLVAAAPVRTVTPSAAAPTVSILKGEEPKEIDPLVSELALMHDAQGALGRGDATLALAKVSEHERKFPSGSLAQEREGTRVLALCAAGRTAEARTSGKAFLAAYGRSPLAERVRHSCAGGSTPSE